MVKAIFWVSIAALVYTFVGYPFAVWLLARFRGRRVDKQYQTPTISVIIACLNEEKRLETRIRNLQACDYPARQLEILIVSDGSTDRTVEIARSYETSGVRVLHYKERRGKPAALNLGVAQATGDLILFADARQSFEPQVMRELAANFADPTVGVVSGAYLISRSEGSTVSEGAGFYWNYESWLRKNEGLYNSIIGATGAIYAIRRHLWQPLPVETILDDVYTPLRIALAGYRVVFEENAIAHDSAPISAAREFARKARTLMGNYQLCQLMPRLLLPTSRLHIQFFSHKLLRLVAPFFMLFLLLSNGAILLQTSSRLEIIIYSLTMSTQAAFYFSVLMGWRLSKTNSRIRLFNVAYVFSVMNAAALVGLFYFLFGKPNVWVRGD